MPDESLVERAWSALEHGEFDEIKTALADLENTSDPKAATAVLGEALGCAHWTLRKVAANQLVRIGPSCLNRLSPLVRRGNVHQVYWACYVLAQVEPPNATMLQSVLNSPNGQFRLFDRN